MHATLATGEPIRIRADKIAYVHAEGEKGGCLVGFEGSAWIKLADSFESFSDRWQKAITD